MSHKLEPDALLADAAWLRLARSLSGSEADADDLRQESWIAAWRKRPETDRSLRPWLTKVVRDFAAMRRRSDRRREAREQVVEHHDVTPPDVLLEQMRMRRLVADLVLELAEPYRSTVIWRYVEGRSAASIARSLDIPESTVRGRLHEALERLRAGLDTKTGTRKAWAPMMVALAQNGVIVTKTTHAVLWAVLLLMFVIAGFVVVPRVLSGPSEPDAVPPDEVGSGFQIRAGSGAIPHVPAWFSVRGAQMRRIAGRVTHESRPVAGAVVSLHSQLVDVGLRAPERRTTNADGGFDFGSLPLSQYKVTAEVPDLVSAIEVIELADPHRQPPPDRLELKLEGCRASVAGTIFDASGGAIAKARVRRDGLAGVVADERGAYKLCVRRGQVDVEYAADGYGSVVLGLDVDGAQAQDVVLVPEATIAIRVVRADDATPVRDAVVFAYPLEWTSSRPQTATAITDVDGRARLGRLVPGPFRVFGFADGLAGGAPITAIAEVGGGPEVILRMDATARLTGRVLANGKPVGDATVVAARTSPLWRSVPGYTAADGTFTLERVAVGETRFTASPYAVKLPAMFRIDAARAYAGVVIEVEALGSISGRVTRLGKPVANIDVCCVQTDNLQQPRRLTDATGRFEFRGVPEGSYEIGGSSDDLGAFAFGKKLALARGEHAVVELELDQAAAIAGTVVDKQGKPVPGVFVRWMLETTGDVGRCSTDANGRYRCAAMSGGGKYRAAVFPAQARMTPYATADGAPYPFVELKAPTSAIDDVTIAIDYQRLTITGRVLDATGAAVADAEVHALPMTDDQPPLFAPWTKLAGTFTGVDGTFTVIGLAPGLYALHARSPDGGEGIVPSLAAGANGVRITVERAGAIAGTLAGYPAPPAIFVRPLDASFRLLLAVVDGTQAYRIAGLKPGRYLVGGQTSAEGDARVTEVRAGQTTTLPLTARGRGVVEVTVLDFRTQAPIASAMCAATMAVDGEQAPTTWNPSSGAKSDARGGLLLDPAPAGSITVSCLMPNPRWSNPAADVVVPTGGRASMRLYSVELTSENGGSSGISFDWRTTAPRIHALTATSPARKAGLVLGDVITAVDNVRVEGLNGTGVAYLIESHPVGSEVSITVARGKTVTFVNPPHAN